MDLTVGAEVEVVYKNALYPKRHLYAFPIPNETVTYTGKVYPRQKWQAPTTLNLTTGDPGFPWRELQDKSIVTIRMGDQVITPADKKTQDRVWQVAGSKGNVYTVTEVSGKRTCTCPGFTFRHSCKHIGD